MALLFSGSGRKGFMHALEGLIAAIVLFFYFSSASLPPLQSNDWTYNSMKQAGTEYINSIEKSDVSEFISQDSRIFSKITNSLFETSDIAIMKGGVPPKDLIVGLVGQSGNEIVVVGGVSRPSDGWCMVKGWYPDNIPRPDCIENESNGLDYRTVLADLDNDGVYDSVYVDLNDTEDYDPYSEGPFSAGGYVDTGADKYYIKYIDSSDESVKFSNITSFAYFKNAQNTTLNGRNTRFIYYAADMSGDISQYDIILITDPVDLTPYLPKLKNFLLSGKGIVEVVNITNGNYNSAQKDLFGLENASYGIIENGSEVSLTESVRSVSEPLRIKDYFSGLFINVPTSYVTPAYDVSEISIPPNVRVGTFDLSSGSVIFAIENTSGTIYDSFYLDSNLDRNFSNPLKDSVAYSVGDSFNTTSREYIIKSIDPYGTYIDVRPSSNASLTNFLNPLLIIPNENSWPVAEHKDLYNLSNMSISQSFNITLYDAPILGDNTTLIEGNYTFGEMNEANSNIIGADYNISATNVSEQCFLNVDFDKDLNYDGLGEGPYSNGDSIRIGAESYHLVIRADCYSVNFTMYSREAVPAAIAGNKYTGRTVWMPDMFDGGGDSRNYLIASMLWASPKNEDVFKSAGYRNIISSRKVFISNADDIFQPYIVEFSRRYG